MGKISVVITSYNSQEKIENCLKSVSFADEIIVVDGSSIDKTLEIAKKYRSKIFVRPNNPMLNVNKNFGFSKAKGDWIFSLDTDERITPELAKEIKEKIGNSVNGYWIPRKNIIFGKWIEHTGWYPDYQLRFFRNGKGKYEEEHVHEMIKVDGKIGNLNGHILHYNYDNVLQFIQKTGIVYAPNEADQLLKKGYIFDWRDSIRFPLKEFLSRFFAREGYKDGFHGLVLSMLMAFYHLVVFAYIWEKQKFRTVEGPKFLDETEKEFLKSSKELSFWFGKEKIKFVRNPLLRLLRKIIRRVKQ